jgi:hypothetical protein
MRLDNKRDNEDATNANLVNLNHPVPVSETETAAGSPDFCCPEFFHRSSDCQTSFRQS